MKFSNCLAALSLGAVALATASSAPDVVELEQLETRTTGSQPSTYGFFTSPKIPDLPPVKLPWTTFNPFDGDSTLRDWLLNLFGFNTPEHRGNWIPFYGINTNYDEKVPPFGKTVRYTFTVTNTTLSPVGVPKQMLVVNGQYPGPKIEANWGDWIEVTVINGMKYNGTSMHWHGFNMRGNNLADGAAGSTECPIAPGGSKVYRFQAKQYGTTWYHSHFSTQYGDGVMGPIVINGPSSANYDIDLGAVTVSDYYDLTAAQEDWFAHRRGPPAATNYLINGMNVAIDGSVGKRAQFKFTPGKKHLLRIINTSMDNAFKLSIDGHTLKVIQADFIPIVPYTTNEVAMQIGQRYHVIVEANQKAGNYWFRAMASQDCSQNANAGTGIANAVISYSNVPNQAALPTSTATNHTNTCIDEPLASLVPIVAMDVDSGSFLANVKTDDVNISIQPARRVRRQGGPPPGGPPGGPGGPPGGPGGPPGNSVFFWSLGGVSQVLDWSKPVIQQAVTGNTVYNSTRNVVFLDQSGQWAYWVIQNRFFVPHPMHLHGHDFHVLGQGNGIFTPASDVSKLNFKNPARRDTVNLVAQGWTVIAFKQDNPGAWLLHCHIAWHAGEGLSQLFVEVQSQIDDLYKNAVNGPDFQNNCKNWQTYDKTSVWPQYDSGLKRRMPDGTQYINWSASKYIKLKERMYSKRPGNVVRKTI